jgi:hypothetical protein
MPAELTKATRTTFERYRRQGWTIHGPMLASDGDAVPAPKAQDKRQSRLGWVGFVVRMAPPAGGDTLHGHGGTPEEAAQDMLAQAERTAR